MASSILEGQFAFLSFCQQATVRQASKLLLKGPVDSELQPHQMLSATNEPQNRKLNIYFNQRSVLCPSNFPGFCSADVLLPPVEVSLSLGNEPMWPAS